MCSTELEEARRDSFVVQDLDVDTLKLMLDYLYLGKVKYLFVVLRNHDDCFKMTVGQVSRQVSARTSVTDNCQY